MSEEQKESEIASDPEEAPDNDDIEGEPKDVNNKKKKKKKRNKGE